MSIYDFEVTTIDGGRTTLAEYRERVLLIVNVASKCGFTPQYAGLEDLYRRYREKGLTILGFPCNQFGAQEPGNADEIKSFCSTVYQVSFPLFAKIDVNGPDEHPLYTYLKSARRGFLGTRSIKWNFTKFLVNRSGEVVGRFGSWTKPRRIERHVAFWADNAGRRFS